MRLLQALGIATVLPILLAIVVASGIPMPHKPYAAIAVLFPAGIVAVFVASEFYAGRNALSGALFGAKAFGWWFLSMGCCAAVVAALYLGAERW
ncbi:hypothetical protein JQR85_13500 [Stutzerimonas urumqiensis]|uniref:hypothetical protein n=1 Tax=Stutzerimonas urumqiensis TaxID=638269 RepID=UPI003DA1E15E